MHDTSDDVLRLRERLRSAVLVWLPATAAGCGSGPAGAPPAPAAAGQDATTPSAAAVPSDPRTPAAPPTAPTPGRFDPIAGDPPYVDGFNPEELTCPTGNWCGDPAAVAKIASAGGEDVMGCRPRIAGSRDSATIVKGPAYAGLSPSPSMLGAFNEGRTKAMRAKGDEDVCCYHWFEYCSGRPILDGEVARSAALEPGNAWIDGRAASDGAVAPPPDPATRRRLAAGWADDALREHAAIAAFGRASLELLAVGAPPELVAGCHRAALDEIEHARDCLMLAQRFGATDLRPGALADVQPRAPDLLRLACDTFDEGCVGESIAALTALRALRQCTDLQTRRVLERIARDEADHAALAFATVAWAVREGGEPVRRGVLERIELARTLHDNAGDAGHGRDQVPRARPQPATDDGRWGRPSAASRRAAAAAWLASDLAELCGAGSAAQKTTSTAV